MQQLINKTAITVKPCLCLAYSQAVQLNRATTSL